MSSKTSRRKIKNAIPNSGGIISMIAQRAGYAWNTVRQFINNDPELLRMVLDEEEGIDDLAESAMIVAIREHDRSAAQWWLARRRKHKFGDALDVTSGNEPLKVIIEYGNDKTTPTTPGATPGQADPQEV
jgi:hypothetical protein